MLAQIFHEAPEPTTPRPAKRSRRLSLQLSEEKRDAPCQQRFDSSEDKENIPPNQQRLVLPGQAKEVYPLVGRESECKQLDDFLARSLSGGAGSGKCLYVSGGPGTGKTCSARASIRHWISQSPDTQVLEVNCMDLTQRSVPGVFQRLLEKLGRGRAAAGKSLEGLAEAVASGLAQLGSRVVLVVDEVDQLVSRTRAGCGALSLESFFSLPRMPGAPAVAIIAIANAVDLLERTSAFMAGFGCKSLLFTTYNKDQLKNIVISRVKAVEGGEAALKAMGPINLELCVRAAAKERGDCRQVLSFIEDALREAKTLSQNAANVLTENGTSSPSSSSTVVQKVILKQARGNDPLQAVSQLTLEQKMLLFVLSGSKKEAVTLSDLCGRYKELCRSLHQPLGSRNQVTISVTALEQRGLLEVRRGRNKGQKGVGEASFELAVSCDVLRKEVLEAVPLLKNYTS